ncbi:SMP-30/gluconolactonase/LRE family protein [Enterovirga sp. CN4-39]|uniref:SMP-30/gluconolactonase/LRE family protein n=1 Tax=Enterovirga sp. CN4-39 TaxID=3400910 RepID=UPI003BFE706A
MNTRLVALAIAGVLASGLAQAQAPASQKAKLETVARFDHQATGVAVTQDGRIFVNFPRWTEDTAVSVAEVKGGKLVPYPDEAWNGWRNAKKDQVTPEDHWVCVQSVVARDGSLWVLDPAAPALEKIVKGGPKLVQIDLATNKVVRTYPFSEQVAPEGTYLNDIRFSPDGRWGYLTDSGRGALLVIDLNSGEIRRVLDGVSSTQAEKGVVVRTDGKELRRPDGVQPTFNSDGIELSPDGATLYWQAISGRTLYSIPTEALRDASLSTQDLESRVKKEGPTVPADGLWMSRKGQFFFTSVEDNSVKLRTEDGKLATIVQDPKLRWPDSMAEGPDGRIYVTASHIMDNRWFNPKAGVATKTELFRFAPPSR